MISRSSNLCSHLSSNIQFMLTKCLTKCLRDYPSLPHSSPSIYNSMIRASIEKGYPSKAILHYKSLLPSIHFHPDNRTLSFVLEACKISKDLTTALGTHARIIKSGFASDPSLLASLVATYAESDYLDHARQVFDETPEWGFSVLSANIVISGYLRMGEFGVANEVFRKLTSKDVVSWNTMIMGCVKNGRFKDGISLFRKMLKLGFEPDGFSFASVIKACGRLGALCHGEWAHALMVEKGIEVNYILSSALIDMYSRCGKIGIAKNVFDTVCRDDVSVWNAMITGLASHGLASEVIAMFCRMEDENVLPDSITFVGILTACSHCGLLEESQQFFERMKREYLIEPELEHYGAMIDLLCRASQLNEVQRMIDSMPMKPDVVIWRSLLSACKTQGMSHLGEAALEKIEHLASGDYVLMSNIYSSTRRWDHAEIVREVMKRKGVRKNRGLSWIEMGGVIHQFKAGDRSHPESDAIYRGLEELIKLFKTNGFVPAMELVLMDVSEEEKECNLSSHSEKLAAVYGIIKSSPGAEIRISKNLRTCYDCHSWMKMVSRVLHRVIIMRDRVRFHQFENGLCSCKDYW